MFVTHVTLADFRSYESADVALAPGVTVLVGSNGQGKTNFIEALEFLATLGSHRVASEAPLIRQGASRAVVRARIQAGVDDPRQLLAEIELLPGRANKASLNRAPLRRPRDLLGSLVTVLFSPDDLDLVKGDPAGRRGFLDDLLTARWPRFAAVRADYDRVVKQRASLLKSMSGRGPRMAADAGGTLDVWDESVARFGAEITVARLATLADLVPVLGTTYSGIAPPSALASAAYKSSVEMADGVGVEELSERLLEAMRARRAEEIARGLCLVGPHRDDVTLTLGDLPAKGYASHGESWSFALALKLASFALLRADGTEPVLLLDDVFAELDEARRARLADVAAGADQVIITAAVSSDVPAVLGGRRLSVAASRIGEAA